MLNEKENETEGKGRKCFKRVKGKGEEEKRIETKIKFKKGNEGSFIVVILSVSLI